MIKRLLSLLLLLGVFTICVPISTSAATGPFNDVCNGVDTSSADAPSICKDNTHGITDPLTGREGEGILIRAARFITFITGIASIIIIIIGAIKFVTSGGDSNSVSSSKKTVLYAVVGLVVSLMAQGIIIFVIKRLN